MTGSRTLLLAGSPDCGLSPIPTPSWTPNLPISLCTGSFHRPRTARWEDWVWRVLGILPPCWPGIRKARRGSLYSPKLLPAAPQPPALRGDPRRAKPYPVPSSWEQPHGHSERAQGFIHIQPPHPARPARLQAPAGQLLPAAVPRAAGLQAGIVGQGVLRARGLIWVSAAAPVGTERPAARAGLQRDPGEQTGRG